MSHTNGIGGSPLLQTLLGQTARTSGSGRANKGVILAGKDKSSAVSAQLSSTASVLSKAVSAGSDVRSEKVAAIKSAIDAGTYNIPAGAVADKLIDHLLQ